MDLCGTVPGVYVQMDFCETVPVVYVKMDVCEPIPGVSGIGINVCEPMPSVSGIKMNVSEPMAGVSGIGMNVSEPVPGTEINVSEPITGIEINVSEPMPGTEINVSEPMPGTEINECEPVPAVVSKTAFRFDMRFFIDLEAMGTKSVIDWCMGVGLLAKEVKCPVCQGSMLFTETKDLKDGYVWVCHKTGENGHPISRSVRKGTCFEASKLSIVNILMMTYLWVKKASNDFIMHELRLSKQTVNEWVTSCREVCMEICSGENVMLGGEGVTVEIDERKFGKGRRVEQWVYGAVERVTNKSFFRVVQHRDRKTLLEIITNNILPGTNIVSSCWKTYDCLGEQDFENVRINHSLSFLNPESFAHTNTIKSTWSVMERSLPAVWHAEGQLDSHLAEFMVRRMYGSEPQQMMDKFLHAVVRMYAPGSVD